MIKRTFLVTGLSLVIWHCSAQRNPDTRPRPTSDSTTTQKTTYQYFGVQANQLLNQLFSFGGSASFANPYLFVYSVNSRTTGIGFNAGMGLSVHSTNANSDPNNTRETSDNSFSLRAGIEKKSYIGKKWLFSGGFDLLYSTDVTDSKTTSKFQQSTTISDVNATTNYFGMGPRVSLNFLITDRIMLGTEATYYLKFIRQNDKINNTTTTVVIDPNTNQQQVTTSTTTDATKTKSNDLVLTSPIALFLILKF